MTAQAVAPSKRFSKANRCPICGGWPGSNPGCKGYEGDNPDYIYCTSSTYRGFLERGKEGQARHKMSGPCHCGSTHGSITPLRQPDAVRTLVDLFDYGHNRFVERYDLGYTREDGKAAKDHKQFQWRGEEKLYVGFKALYRIEEVLAADPALPVFVAEGERKVNKLWELGYPATCNVGGSGAWKAEYGYAEKLVGRTIMIWPDNDEPGQKFATAVSEDLTRVKTPWHILNDLTVGLPDTGGDVLDWVKIEGNDKARLDKVVAAHLNAGSDIFEVLDYFQLIALPKPAYLVEPFLVKGYVSCVFGAFQTAKSFWALMQALNLADQGFKVLYLAGENAAGYGQRAREWYDYFDKEPNSNFKLIRRPLNFLEPEVIDKLIRTIKNVFDGSDPVLIIVDTLSKSYRGGDENSVTDMGRFIESCERLRDTFGSTILAVHHTGKNGDSPRGSSAILGDFDTLILAKKVVGVEKLVTFECVKQKDAPEFEPVTYKVVPIGENTIERSCVIVEQGNTPPPVTGVGSSLHVSKEAGQILLVLAMRLYENGVSPSGIMDQLGIPYRTDKAAKARFDRTLNFLLTGRYIKHVGRGGRNVFYGLEQKGRDVVEADDLSVGN